MRIAIDARCISSDHPTGIEKTILRLLENLPPLRHSIYLFTNKTIPRPFDKQKIISSRVKNDGIWFHVILPLLLAKEKIDWFISPITQLPKILPSRIKTCVFVYDLAYKFFPDEYDREQLKILLNKTDQSIKRADRIITISIATKKDLESFFPENKKNIDILPLACDEIKGSQSIENLDFSSPAILMIGSGYGRKNFQILSPTLSLLKIKYRLTPRVLIIGQPSKNLDKVFSTFAQEIKKQITHLGYVSDGQKNCLLSRSSLLFFPSFYEGFGIPVLEAMKSRCPVVCSNTSSLPEIAADGAITVNPKSAEECASAIAKIILDHSFREGLITRADVQIKNFSWAKSASAFAGILNKFA